MHAYYKAREKQLQKEYQRLNHFAAELLHTYYDQESINKIMEQVTQETDEIIKRLPYIGGYQNALTPAIELNGWFIGFFKTMSRFGFTPEAVGYIFREVFIRLCNQIPQALRRPITNHAFSKMANRYFRNQAKNSQKCIYPEDFVFTFRADPLTNEYTFIFSSCAIQKQYEAEDTNALKRFCNFAAPVYSATLNTACSADYSFATRYNTCTLCFKRGKEARKPENITRMIKEGKSFLEHHRLPDLPY